jgi:tetratricopeptide (TPR) repeat protein
MPHGSLQCSPNSSRLLRRARRAHANGEFAKASKLYAAVLDHEPENFDALHGLGRLHCDCGRRDTALVLLQRALKIDPFRADGFSSLGLVFYSLHRFADALRSFEEGLRLTPNDAELLNGRGVVLLEIGHASAALESFEHALAADPDHLDALGNYGNALLRLNRPVEALAIYDRALAIVPDNPGLLTNRAIALRRVDRPQEALTSVSRALASKPDFAQARFVESLLRLTLGEFAAGWRSYESRWLGKLLSAQRRDFIAPLWRGEGPLQGKTILLHAEQGFGDTIQFVRYAPLVAERGGRVILEVQRELVRLLSGMKGVAAVIARGEPLPPFDLHCPLLSLPLAFGTVIETIPACLPYIDTKPADMQQWRGLMPHGRPRIGVAWAGDPAHDNDLNRSMRLKTLAPLFDLTDVSFISLQHKVRPEDAETLPSLPRLRVLDRGFADFADTAAVIASLDAVVSIDSAVAHLAGAMGKPLLLLLPLGADFRWLRERTDSPWYPTAHLFRQTSFGDWSSAVEALTMELRARFHGWSEESRMTIRTIAASGGERRRPLGSESPLRAAPILGRSVIGGQ